MYIGFVFGDWKYINNYSVQLPFLKKQKIITPKLCMSDPYLVKPKCDSISLIGGFSFVENAANFNGFGFSK